jgi:hypothetical protein
LLMLWRVGNWLSKRFGEKKMPGATSIIHHENA